MVYFIFWYKKLFTLIILKHTFHFHLKQEKSKSKSTTRHAEQLEIAQQNEQKLTGEVSRLGKYSIAIYK